MFAVSVRDHVMIAHSFQGDVFGPARRLHGATYVVDIELRAPELDEDGVVIDIGWATQALGQALEPLRFRNLDEIDEFQGKNTTTEYLARHLFQRMHDMLIQAHGQKAIKELPVSMKVTLHESHVAWASYEDSVSVF